MTPETMRQVLLVESSAPSASAAVATGTLRDDQVKLGLWMFLATVTMLFAAFASAYIVRRSGSDWRHVALPSILWWNTLVLAASSAAVEIASWGGARAKRAAAVAAMAVALALGVVFLAGQAEAWRQMRASGVYLPTSPHSSFFFMLTGAHAVHVVAALAVLTWGAMGTLVVRDGRRWAARMSVCRTFWHYLGAVWLFLFALVSIY
jgi:cytochrome c oxidase subunit III